jgi:long-subunit fatty acid transport protein
VTINVDRTHRISAPRGRTLRAMALGACLAVALLLPGRAVAQVGGSAVVFLKIEPDSRASGMGNAGVALADNASAMFWNPAGLAFQTGTEASITHSAWLPEFQADLFYEYLIAKHHVPGWGTFGAHLTYLFLGEHEGRDAQNNPTGTFRSYDMAAGLSYGTKLSEQFGIGTSVRFIYSNLAPGQVVGAQETKAGVSTAFDVAGLYRTRPFSMGETMKGTLSAGFNLANMGPKIQYSDNAQADPIPTNLRFGYAFKVDFDDYNSLTWVRTNALADDEAEFTSLSVIDQLTIGTGLEYWYNDLFALRAGYFYENPDNGNRKYMTLGAGVRVNIIGVDFSYIYAEQDSPLANTMRFSMLVDFGK